mmetsp:Transcript_11275/g.20402  ORF Transcript_11275/g.20402 Transcript_11275/m.20402 type:complete len:122 (+) Transcript_11275:1062-1427(+)
MASVRMWRCRRAGCRGFSKSKTNASTMERKACMFTKQHSFRIRSEMKGCFESSGHQRVFIQPQYNIPSDLLHLDLGSARGLFTHPNHPWRVTAPHHLELLPYSLDDMQRYKVVEYGISMLF